MQKLLLSMTMILPLVFASQRFHSANSKDSVRHQTDSESHLLEIGHASRMRTVMDSPSEVKVVSYNIRWRGGEELRQLAQLLKEDTEIGGAAILGLQEVDRNKKRTGNENTAKILAEELGMYYAWAAPSAPDSETRAPRRRSAAGVEGGNSLGVVAEEETGVVILSSYPLSHLQRIILPHEGPGGRRRVALGATVTLGQTSLRVYSVHSETRISVDRKVEQMKAVLEDLDHYPKGMPAVVLGDFNTWEQDAVAKTFKLFSAESFQTPFDEQPTFFRRALFVSIDLKLDWIWVRNLESSGYGVNRKVELSDHWPLWVVLRTRTRAS
jgi:endonuclease/exonuclease/phosphatase family metal-dependent hydrolase